MKKIILSLLFTGFCLAIKSGQNGQNPISIDCIVRYPTTKRLHCLHHGDSFKHTTKNNCQFFLFNDPDKTPQEHTLLIEHDGINTTINLEDLIDLKKKYTLIKENTNKLNENKNTFTSFEKNIRTAVWENGLKTTAAFSGATLLSSLFFNFSDKTRYCLFAGSCGLGLFANLLTKPSVEKEKKHFNKIQKNINTEIKDASNYTRGVGKEMIYRGGTIDYHSPYFNDSQEDTFADCSSKTISKETVTEGATTTTTLTTETTGTEHPYKFSPVGFALLHKILKTSEAGTVSTGADMNNIAKAELAFKAIEEADKELENKPESFIKNVIHFLAHATEKKQFPGFTLFKGNPLNTITNEYSQTIKRWHTYTPSSGLHLKKASLLFGGVMAAWALDLKTGALRNGAQKTLSQLNNVFLK